MQKDKGYDIIFICISSEVKEAVQGNVQEIVAKRWQDILKGTDLVPIDVHTPMWLWSRGKFRGEI